MTESEGREISKRVKWWRHTTHAAWTEAFRIDAWRQTHIRSVSFGWHVTRCFNEKIEAHGFEKTLAAAKRAALKAARKLEAGK